MSYAFRVASAYARSLPSSLLFTSELRLLNGFGRRKSVAVHLCNNRKLGLAIKCFILFYMVFKMKERRDWFSGGNRVNPAPS